MVFTHYPHSPFGDLRRDIHRAFGLNGFAPRVAAAPAWTPPVDIREDAERFVIYADVPGLDPKDIEITFEKGVLAVKGERPAPPREELARYSLLERPKLVFERRFQLPDNVDPQAITARGVNGVLEISIGKKPAEVARKIMIE